MRKESRGYPLRMIDNRTLPEGYDGPVFVWDVDKTYLVTHFSSLRGLSRIPIEFAVDKKAIAGMPEILRGLRRGPGDEVACAPLYFVTGSPPLLRKVLETKMLMDGVEFDGITFKDWMRTLRERRLTRLKEQVGYKVCALLTGRLNRPRAVEYLFGDDVEMDATAFHLYALLVHGEISAGDAVESLSKAGVGREDRKNVMALVDRLPTERGEVKKIFIHLSRKTPPERFNNFGDLVIPVKNSFQLGLSLYELGLIDIETVRHCLEAFSSEPGAGPDKVKAHVEDARARGLITRERASDIEGVLPA